MAYPDSVKAGALAVLDANDGNVYRTAKHLGLPNTTVEDWSNGQFLNENVSEIRNRKRVELSDKFDSIIGKIASNLDDDERLKATPLGTQATVLGIVFDKRRLLNDESTSNVAVARPEHEYIAAAVKLLTSRGYTVIAPVEAEIIEPA